LLDVLTQAPEHSTSGVVQLTRQVPPTQAWPKTHALPQLPQFCGSLDVSAMHAPLSPPSPPSPGVSLEQAANHDMPTRIPPRSSQRCREVSLLSDDRMVRPFMMFT
jgi:hypothetical protein